MTGLGPTNRASGSVKSVTITDYWHADQEYVRDDESDLRPYKHIQVCLKSKSGRDGLKN